MLRSAWYVLGCLAGVISSNSWSQVVTDGSMGPATALPGPDYVIADGLGTRAGANLFHSFERFGLTSGESATFIGPADIVRVISRVTGGQVSFIDGLLRSAVGSADFYFINPAGVVLGANAQIDVPAGLHIGAADELRFPAGARYSAREPSRSTLSVAAPESFGYLGQQGRALVIEDANLALPDGGAVSLSAGEVSIAGTLLSSSNGQLRISAVGQQSASVPLDGELPALSGELRIEDSDLRIVDFGDAVLDLSGGPVGLRSSSVFVDNYGMVSSTGGVSVRADTLTLDRAKLTADALSEGDAARIRLNVFGLASLLNGSEIVSDTYAEGDAVEVRLSAGALLIDGSVRAGGISSQVRPGSGGDGASVEVTVDGSMGLLGQGVIATSTTSQGDAGPIRISAGEALLDGAGVTTGFSGLASLGAPDSAGSTGSIDLSVDGLLRIVDGAQITSTTVSAGDSGLVRVSAGGLLIDGRGNPSRLAGIFSSVVAEDAGDAGDVDVDVVGLARLLDGAAVFSSALLDGDSGRVRFHAGELFIDGRGADERYVTGISSQVNPGSSGNAGRVEVVVDRLLTLLPGAVINSDTFSEGDAGDVLVAAGELLMDSMGDPNRPAGISSRATSDSTGDAGSIEVNVAGLARLLNGSRIVSDTSAQGHAGEVRVTANTLRIDSGQAPEQMSAISSDANRSSTGDAGSVEVSVTGLLSLQANSAISSDTSSVGDAGEVRVSASQLQISKSNAPFEFSGISSQAQFGSSGAAGSVEVIVAGRVSLVEGGEISSSTFGQGDAGAVMVSAGELLINSGDSYAAISSDTQFGNGDAGSVEVSVTGLASLINGGLISSSTRNDGSGGTIRLSAGELLIDGANLSEPTGVLSEANRGAGDAGRVEVTVTGTATLLARGAISSNTLSDGDAGAVRVTTGALSIDGSGAPFEFTGISSGNTQESTGAGGSVEVTVAGLASLVGGGRISSDTFNDADAGQVTVVADALVVDGQAVVNRFTGISSAAEYRSGNAGRVDVTVAGSILLRDVAEISSSTNDQGNAGEVRVAAGELRIDGESAGQITGISSRTNILTTGNAGSVEVHVDRTLQLLRGAEISSTTSGAGDAGQVLVTANELRIEGADDANRPTGISSGAGSRTGGDGGSVAVQINGLASLLRGAEISSTTSGLGDAGQVRLRAGALLIDGMGVTGDFTGISTSALQSSRGNAGDIAITIDGLATLLDGAGINSDTFGEGNAGQVQVFADELLIDDRGRESQSTAISSSAGPGSAGDAGGVEVNVVGLATLLGGGVISGVTNSVGDAGTVRVSVGDLLINGSEAPTRFTGITSQATSGTTGNAGRVEVAVERSARLLAGGNISSSTFGTGAGGQVQVAAGELLISQMGADARFTGIQSITAFTLANAGSVEVTVQDLLEIVAGGEISSASFGEGNAGLVHVQAGELLLDNTNAQNLFTGITSSAAIGSSGDAGSVVVNVDGLARLIDGAGIYSEVVTDGQGGDLSVSADALFLHNGLITTSVNGDGLGGDISVNTEVLTMDTGFIQANTGTGDRGGDILIDVQSLITRNGVPPQVGGNQRAAFVADSGFNVIQAAAPGGEQGQIRITAPELDLNAGLSALSAQGLVTPRLARDPCTAARQDDLSSLVVLGRGGLPPAAGGTGISGGRLNRLLDSAGENAAAIPVPPASAGELVGAPCSRDGAS